MLSAKSASQRLGRRRILKTFALVATAGAVVPLLQACGSATSTTGATSAGSSAAAPTSTSAATSAAATASSSATTAASALVAPSSSAALSSTVAAATSVPSTTVSSAAAATTAAASSGVVGQINVTDLRKYAGQTIHLAVQDHPATTVIKNLSPGFQQQTGITVSFDQIPQQQLSQKQVTDLSTGTGTYDVIGWFLDPEFVANKWVWSIDELRAKTAVTDDKLLALDDFFPKFLQLFKYPQPTGPLYGLPFYGESLMMYYNSEEFGKVGVDKAPTTVADLEDVCKKIKGAGRMAGIALRGTNDNASIYPFLAWLYGYGGSWFNLQTGAIGLTEPGSIAATEAWAHFMRDYAPPDVASYYWNEVQLAIQQEKAAIIMDATNFGPRLEDPKQSKIAGKVGYAALPEKLGADGKPIGPAEVQGRFGYSCGSYALSVPRDSKKSEAAWLFIQWATSPDVMLKTTEGGQRADPTRKSSLNSPTFGQTYNYGNGAFVKTLNQSFDLAMPSYWPPVLTGTQLTDTLGLALGNVLTGKQSAKDALSAAQDKSVQIQKKAGLLK